MMMSAYQALKRLQDVCREQRETVRDAMADGKPVEEYRELVGEHKCLADVEQRIDELLAELRGDEDGDAVPRGAVPLSAGG